MKRILFAIVMMLMCASNMSAQSNDNANANEKKVLNNRLSEFLFWRKEIIINPGDIESGRITGKDFVCPLKRTPEQEANDERVKAILKEMMGLPQGAKLHITRQDSAYNVSGYKHLGKGQMEFIKSEVIKFKDIDEYVEAKRK